LFMMQGREMKPKIATPHRKTGAYGEATATLPHTGTQVHQAGMTQQRPPPLPIAHIRHSRTMPALAATGLQQRRHLSLLHPLRQPRPATPCNPCCELCQLQFAGKAATLWQSGQCCDRRSGQVEGRGPTAARSCRAGRSPASKAGVESWWSASWCCAQHAPLLQASLN
jgi:hypothetical protein